MKTITEFSGVLLQRAAEVQRAFLASNPRPAAPPAAEGEAAAESVSPPAVDVAAPAADSAPATADAPPAAAAEAPAAADGDAAAETTAAETTAAEATPTEAVAPVDLGTGPEAEAVGAALGMEGDRLSRLMEALDVVGRRVGQVRLVRVLQGENPPQGAQQRGDFYYAVDLTPRPQAAPREGFEGRDRDRRRGPGGRDRGGRPGGPGGARGGGGPPGKGGKFSNDRPSRDGDLREARGEVPRAGAGWTLTRAPDDHRGGRSDGGPGERRDRRPPRGPRFDGRGPRPPTGAAGDRTPRGPRPDRGGGRPFSGGRGPIPQRAAGPGEGAIAEAAPASAEPRRSPGPRSGGASRPRYEPRNWTGPRRGGWDEPAVPDQTQPSEGAVPASEPPRAAEAQPTPTADTPPAAAAGESSPPTPTEHE